MDKCLPWVGHPGLWLKGSGSCGDVVFIGVLRFAQDDGKNKNNIKNENNKNKNNIKNENNKNKNNSNIKNKNSSKSNDEMRGFFA